MHLTVNGEKHELPEGSTVLDLIASLGLEGPVAVECNEEVVPRATHATTQLFDGDRLEIVHFVGGG